MIETAADASNGWETYLGKQLLGDFIRHFKAVWQMNPTVNEGWTITVTPLKTNGWNPKRFDGDTVKEAMTKAVDWATSLPEG